MGRINYGRVLLGGLLAGVVVNVSEFILNGLVLADAYSTMAMEYNLTEASWAMIGYILTAFAIGLVVVWLYAAIRPRFGPGPKTAAIAGIALWVPVYFVQSVWLSAMGLTLAAGALVTTLIWGLVELVLAGVAGAWLYQEGDTAAGAPARPSAEPPPGPPTI